MEIITTHKNVDFDAFASVFAASLLYPQATPVVPTSINPNIRSFLSIHKDLFPFSTANDISLENVQRLIVVDANSWSRLENMAVLREKPDINITVWDHHEATGDIIADASYQSPTGAVTSCFTSKVVTAPVGL